MARARLDAPPVVVAQDNFGAGMFQSVAPHLIPGNGFRDGVNVLADEDGSLYKRGPGRNRSTGTVSGPTRCVWAGELAAGPRVVVVTSAKTYVLMADESLLEVAASGMSAPGRPVVIGGMLVLPGGLVFAGARDVDPYSTGTVAVTQGSPTVTGTGTTFTGNVVPGGLVRVNSGRYYAVKSVDSATQLTLAEPFVEATASGQSYGVTATGTVATVSGVTSDVYAVAGNRLWATVGGRAYMSSPTNPFSFATGEEFHDLPAGAVIVGAEELRGVLYLFSTQGVWAVTNTPYDLTDAFGNQQQALEQVSRDLVLWDDAGVVSWGGSIVVPATDGVWLLGPDGPSRLVRRDDGIDPIHDLWQSYVKAGHRLGGAAVFSGHYLVPVLSAGAWVDTLVCRLAGGPAWTRMQSGSGEAAGFAVEVSSAERSPVLLSLPFAGSAYLMDASAWFDSDTDAQVGDELVAAEIVFRDFAGGSVAALWKKARVWYELEQMAESGADPTMQLGYGTEARSTATIVWGAFVWGAAVWSGSSPVSSWVAADAPLSDGSVEWPVLLNVRARFLRPALRVDESVARGRFVLRAVELFVRPSGRT